MQSAITCVQQQPASCQTRCKIKLAGLTEGPEYVFSIISYDFQVLSLHRTSPALFLISPKFLILLHDPGFCLPSTLPKVLHSDHMRQFSKKHHFLLLPNWLTILSPAYRTKDTGNKRLFCPIDSDTHSLSNSKNNMQYLYNC